MKHVNSQLNEKNGKLEKIKLLIMEKDTEINNLKSLLKSKFIKPPEQSNSIIKPDKTEFQNKIHAGNIKLPKINDKGKSGNQSCARTKLAKKQLPIIDHEKSHKLNSVIDRKLKSQVNDRSIIRDKLNNYDSMQASLNKKSGYYGLNLGIDEKHTQNYNSMNYSGYNENSINKSKDLGLNLDNKNKERDLSDCREDDNDENHNFNEIKMMMKSVLNY